MITVCDPRDPIQQVDGWAAARAELTVETCPLREGELPAEWLDEWVALFSAAPDARPHQHPQIVMIEAQAARAAGQGEGLVVCCRRAGRMCALAALLPKRVPLGGVQRLLGASLRGYWLVGGDFLAADDQAARAELARGIRGWLRRSRSDLMVIDDVAAPSPVWRDLAAFEEAGFRCLVPAGMQPRRLIHMPQSAAEYYGKFTAKTRSKFKRVIRKLGEVHVVRVTEPDQIPYFLEQAHEVSKNSWQARQLGLRVAKSPREFALYEGLARLGAFRSYLLEQHDRPVAFCIAFQHRGRFALDEIGYDLAYNQQSPGQVLQLKMIDDLFAHDRPNMVDFGGGDAEYKRLFSNEATTGGTVWVLRPGLRSLLLRAMLLVQRRAGLVARRLLQGAGLFRQLRQRYRFKTASAAPGAAAPAEENAESTD